MYGRVLRIRCTIGKGGERVKQLLCVALLAALAGCDKPASVQPPAEKIDAHAKMQAELEAGTPEFSHVVSVRLSGEGKRVEVSSVLPITIAEATLSGQSAKTIFRVNPAGDALILFSRDLQKGSSFRTEIKFSELESKKGFAFPVVQPDGSLREQRFELERIARL